MILHRALLVIITEPTSGSNSTTAAAAVGVASGIFEMRDEMINP